jgi:hypothetical protein
LLLEGADLAALMVHVRAEFGPTARIVRAERVRTGGVAGFFARERYELTVDVPDAPAVERPSLLRRRRGVPAGAVGIDALLAAADEADAGLAGDAVLAPEAPAGVPEVPGPRVSTGEEAFAEVLQQMRAMTGTVAPDHQIEVPAADDASAPAAPAVVTRAGDGRATPGLVTPVGAVPAPVVPAPVVPTPVPAPAVESTGPGVPRTALADLGVPPALLAACGDGPVELARLLAAVPAAPALPREPGSVLVVAGPPEDAARVAGLIALRTGAGEVVPAGDADAPAGVRRLTTATAVARWRGERPETDGPTVVALGVRPGRAREDSAAELLAALAPDQAWGVIDARSKTRDCARWIGTVGARRPLDALAVGGLFDTSEPGTVLGLGVPVAWIDGVPASRVAWAAALGEHLPEGTVWG